MAAEWSDLDLKKNNIGVLMKSISDDLSYLRENIATTENVRELKERLDGIDEKLEELTANGGTGNGCPCCPYVNSNGEDDS